MVLLDTNVLLRLTDPADAYYAFATTAMRKLIAAGAILCVCPQNMQELRQVATRPVASNGLGWSSSDATAHITVLETNFVFLAETDEIYPIWKRIADVSQAVGRANFDARLVAVAVAHGATAVLTFEAAAFARYAAAAPVLILDPAAV